jgi:hypothetical protein
MRTKLTLAVSLILLSLYTPVEAKILWIATEDTTGHEIAKESDDGGSVSVVGSPVRAGSASFRHSLPGSGGRAEIKTKPTQIGGTYWYGVSYFIPQNMNVSSYTIINQFGAFPSANAPFPCGGIGSKMSMREGKLFLDFQRQGEGGSRVKCDKVPLIDFSSMKGKWTDIVMHVKWTGNTDGFWKIWIRQGTADYVLKMDHKGRTFWNNEGAGPNFKWGGYSGGGSNRSFYSDEMRIGDQDSCFDEVAPGSTKNCSGGTNPPAGTKFTLPLQSGWNLISVPLSAAERSPDKIFSGINGSYEAVYSFDGTNYQDYVPGVTGGSLTSIEPGRGYWIYMTKPASLEITGSAATSGVQLKTGWNLVGYNSTGSKAVAEALSSISGKFDAVYSFDTASNSYRAYVPGEAGDLTTLEAGRGYWIYVNADATWTLP